MDRTRLWPDWRGEWIVHEDAAVLAVAKPAGVPSQAPDPARPDDVVARVKRFLETRDGSPPYLGVHQRLDRDTSGVLLLAKRREANPGLARQFEGRTVVKEYVAAVRGYGGGERTLRNRIAPDDQGAMRVVGPRNRRGKTAVTHVRPLERRGDRWLVSLRIETGRTHQIRVQLAHGGWPVAGDASYGGPPAARLMLHACALELDHPTEGSPLRVAAAVPEAMRRWLDGEDAVPLTATASLHAAVRTAAHRRWGLARLACDGPEPTDCFRLLHGEGEGVPGLALDVYAGHLVAHLYASPPDAELDPVLELLGDMGFDGVYLKRHPRQANVVGDAVAAGLAPPDPVRGRPAPDPLCVHEHGLPYRVRLGDGLGTGLFLDQRDNRRRVRDMANGRRVLNLFAHTGAFTVAAAAGGARATVSVDASRALLDRGREQVRQAVDGGDHRWVHADVFEHLDALVAKGERFELVIVDPPTYSRTRASRWRSGTDWRRLAQASFRVTERDGRVLLCSNDRRMPGNRFRRYVHEAARAAGRRLRSLRNFPPPRDFPGPSPHLHTLLATLG